MSQTWIDRSGWAAGPWDDEPDRIEWRDEVTGLPCLMLRNAHAGMWCGYVGLPPDHPWHGLDYDSLDSVHEATHGGLTFAGPCMEDERPVRERVCHVPRPGESADVWWLGFDCHHSLDVAPGHEARQLELAVSLRAEGNVAGAQLFECLDPMSTYRDVGYVRSCVTELASACLPASGSREDG